MAAKRKTAAKKQLSPTGDTELSPIGDTLSATGMRLIDGLPYFTDHDGVAMNRRQWLEVTKDQRKQALIDELRNGDPEDA